MKVHIKNMVCNRCCLAVKNVVKNLGLNYVSIDLGTIDFSDYYGEKLPTDDETQLSHDLEALGFTILNDKKSKLIESIKMSCLSYINNIDQSDKRVLSNHITKTIRLEYNYLSNLFSGIEGMTIEEYFIRLRVEKVKEFLVYGEIPLSEISFQLGFSSVSHLSSQFKKITGLTPSCFRSLKNEKLRRSLDNL